MKDWFSQQVSSIRGGITSKEPLEVGRALTKLFLAMVILLAILPQETETGWNFRAFEFLKAPFNEIGDTFAGIAGVLAFLWIIVTVWLQSKELAAQREELELTRQEFSKMAAAQSKQVDVLVAQGEIFKEEQKQRAEAAAGDLLRERLLLFVAKVQQHRLEIYLSVEPGRHFGKVPGQLVRSLSGRLQGLLLLPPVHDRQLEQQMIAFDEELREVIRAVEAVLASKPKFELSNNYDKFHQILSLIESISFSQLSLSEADQNFFFRVRVPQVLEKMKAVSEFPIWAARAP